MNKRGIYLNALILSISILLLLVNTVKLESISVFSPLSVANDVCFVIDAGHGGVDGGATSCSGVLESQLNLEIAIKLNDLLHFLGYETKMIRTTDVSVYTYGDTIAQKKLSDLKERVRICNESEKAILLSIHQNTFSDARYDGAQVFYSIKSSSEKLAKEMQNLFIQILNPGSKRNVKKGEGIYLLEHIDCPGVLIECGFLSNPKEEMKLRDAAYQRKICSIIAVSAIEYANT